MKRLKTIGISILVATCAVCLSLAFVACKGGEESAKYGAGEEGFYYYDGADSARYMLSLQSGTYMITAGNVTQYSGSYSYDEDTGVVSFTGDENFTAIVGENALSLDMGDSGYSFKAYRYFDVTYVDENGKVVATESVLNGQSAEVLEIEKDGYWFIGWYEDPSNSSEFAFNTSIAGDTTVYGWYIEKNPRTTEYEITLDYGDGTTETVSTMNGAVWTLPSEGILGWWVSDTNKSGELTYKYENGTAFKSDTTLFAVSSGIGASVTGTGITWENATGSNVTIVVYDDAGNQVLYAAPSSTSGQYSYDFTALSSGTYTVEVTSGSTSETLVYVVNGLVRVSMSSVDIIVNGDGRVISFAPVDGATGYEITITDGTKTVTENLGSHTYYNFSAWDMTKDGITFTVTAYATGYVSSASDSYTYRLVLDDVSVDIVDDEVVWNRVENAVEYRVTVKDADGNVYETFTTSATSYSLKYYDAGTYTISVQPVTDGYWSEASEYKQYSKVSLASPVITDITNYTITWEGDDKAESYVVMINGVEYAVTDGTTLAFSDGNVPTSASSYEISVKAVGENDSLYSDTVLATNGGFSSAVTYEKNTVYWSYDVAATYYVVSVNGTDTSVSDGNSLEIVLNKAGTNEITVTAYDAAGSLGQATVEVYAYSVILDTNGATLENSSAVNGVIYVAQGDAMNLGETYKEYADFMGWYTQADFTEGQSDSYEGKGSEVEDGSVFTGSRDMYLYAYWSYEYVTVTLDAGDGTLVDENGNDITEIQIKYNSSSFTVPTPGASGVTYDFAGWYSGTLGGSRYTDETGSAVSAFTFDYGQTMYAQYVLARNYTKTSYGGETVYSVTGRQEAASMTVMTVPEYVDDNGNTYPIILNSGAFAECTYLEVLNLPDSVRYISLTSDGYSSGSGAFAQCAHLREVNLYSTGNVTEPVYFTEDGVLFHKLSNSDDVELLYYPYAKKTDSYVIPSYVYNEDETDWDGSPVTHAVTTLPSRVFRYREVSEVVIPTTVTNMETRVFYGNNSLTSVAFEAGGTEPLTIADEMFYDCPNVKSITLPARYTDFSSSAISGLTGLENIYVEDGSVYMSDSGVLLDDAGATILYFPVGRGGDIDTATLTSTKVTAVGDGAFAGNKKVTSVTIDADVTYIGTSAFDGCSGIKTITFKGDGNSAALTIKSRAFYGCTLVKEIELPANLTVLEANAFGGCSNLSYVYFDSFAEAKKDDLSFAANAFGSSNNIKTVEFGEYVPEISNFGNVFDGGNLREVIIDDNNKNYSSVDGVLLNANQTTIIYYPRGIVGGYTVPDTVTEIGSSVFSDRANLTYIVIGPNVNTIADGAFSGCTFLTGIYVDPANANYGNVYTYADDGVTLVGDGVLYARAEVADTAQSVGDLVTLMWFPMASEITELEVPYTVTKISADAFRNNTVIKKVTFERNEKIESGEMTEIDEFTMGTYVFYGSSIESIDLPQGLTDIPNYTFRDCSNLTYVGMPDSVTSVGTYAFYACQSLVGDLSPTYEEGKNGIILNEGITTIGTYAFYNDYYLAVSIPSTVTTINSNAFYNCWYYEESGSEIVFREWKDESADSADPLHSDGVSAIDDDEEEEDEEDAGAPDLTIGSSAFYGTHYLSKIEIPARTVEIGSSAFCYAGDSSETTVLTFEEGNRLTTIGNNALQYMSTLKEVNIPASVTSLGTNMFRWDEALEEVTFGTDEEPSKVTSIGTYTFYDTAITSINIPATVTSIGTYVFQNVTTLTEVTFEKATVTDENGVGTETTALTSIGNYAFAGSAVTSVEIPASVTSLGTNVFNGCVSLTSVTFAEGKNGLTSIGTKCFYGSSITGITIPASVTTISENAFNGCASLATVNFETGSALSSLGANVFANCTSLAAFMFPETAADGLSLGAGIFDGDTLSSLTLSSSVTNLGSALAGATVSSITVPDEADYVYQTYSSDGTGCVLYSGTSIVFVCDKITTTNSVGEVTLTIPDTVTAIADGAFTAHTEIVNVEISKDVGYIGSYAFYGCTGIKNVTIESGSALTGDSSIGTHAFDGCSALEYINLPYGITTIPQYCFYGAGPMSQTEIPKSVTLIDQYAFSESLIVNLKLEFDGVTKIAGSAFRSMTELSAVKLGEGLTEFTSSYAFGYCSKLQTVEFPDSCTTLGTYIFYECTALEAVILPEGMSSLGSNEFYNCTSLKEITIPSTVTELGQSCFQGCSSLVSVEISNSVTSIAAYCFCDCTSLESIILPENLTVINSNTFQGCSSLRSVDFGPNITTINNYAFTSCSSLEYVYIPSSVTSLGGYMFQNCTSLVYAYTGDQVTNVTTYTFLGCTSLRTVELGPAVTTIGMDCFNGCVSLEYIEIPSSVTSFLARAFSGCVSLTSIYLSSAVSSVAVDTFAGCHCDIYIDNLPNYVAGWTSGWNGSGETANTGTVYYYSAVEPDFNENGTGYANDYWYYDEDGNIAVWEFTYETYTVTEGGYVLYDADADVISYVCLYETETETSTVYAVTECSGGTAEYTVTLENGGSYTIVLSGTTATVTAA